MSIKSQSQMMMEHIYNIRQHSINELSEMFPNIDKMHLSQEDFSTSNIQKLSVLMKYSIPPIYSSDQLDGFHKKLTDFYYEMVGVNCESDEVKQTDEKVEKQSTDLSENVSVENIANLKPEEKNKIVDTQGVQKSEVGEEFMNVVVKEVEADSCQKDRRKSSNFQDDVKTEKTEKKDEESEIIELSQKTQNGINVAKKSPVIVHRTFSSIQTFLKNRMIEPKDNQKAQKIQENIQKINNWKFNYFHDENLMNKKKETNIGGYNSYQVSNKSQSQSQIHKKPGMNLDRYGNFSPSNEYIKNITQGQGKPHDSESRTDPILPSARLILGRNESSEMRRIKHMLKIQAQNDFVENKKREESMMQDVEKMTISLNYFLNVMTKEYFEDFSNQIAALLMVGNQAIVEIFCDKVIEKVKEEHNFINLYVQLIKKLRNLRFIEENSAIDHKGKSNKVMTMFVDMLQASFFQLIQNDHRFGDQTQKQHEKLEEQYKYRKVVIGLCTFIGKLIKEAIIPRKIFKICFWEIIHQYTQRVSDDKCQGVQGKTSEVMNECLIQGIILISDSMGEELVMKQISKERAKKAVQSQVLFSEDDSALQWASQLALLLEEGLVNSNPEKYIKLIDNVNIVDFPQILNGLLQLNQTRRMKLSFLIEGWKDKIEKLLNMEDEKPYEMSIQDYMEEERTEKLPQIEISIETETKSEILTKQIRKWVLEEIIEQDDLSALNQSVCNRNTKLWPIQRCRKDEKGGKFTEGFITQFLLGFSDTKNKEILDQRIQFFSLFCDFLTQSKMESYGSILDIIALKLENLMMIDCDFPFLAEGLAEILVVLVEKVDVTDSKGMVAQESMIRSLLGMKSTIDDDDEDTMEFWEKVVKQTGSRANECLCDITDQCDSQCCCDATCSADIVVAWAKFGICSNDNLGIPFCSSLSSDVNALDMHSGLRTIYTVIKRLFCISTVNFVTPGDFYTTSLADNDLNGELDELTISKQQSVTNTDLNIFENWTITGLPLLNGNGQCRSSTSLVANKNHQNSCRVYIASSADISASLLSIDPLKASLGVTLNQFTTSDVSTSSAIPSTTLVTSCSGTTCLNVVRQIQIYINSEDGTVNSNSYLIVGPMQVDSVGYISVNYEYTYVSTSGTETILPYESNTGYGLDGSDLGILFADTAVTPNTYHKINNPINLAFRKQDGTCRTATTDLSANSVISLKFGQNAIYSCFGTSNMIYNNFVTVMNYLSKYGTASSVLNDYVSINLPSTAIAVTQSVQFVIHYISIGSASNRQYEIVKAEVKPVTIKDGLSSLYVEYVDVRNVFELYVPSPPTVDAYLANDFLYPFYVAE